VIAANGKSESHPFPTPCQENAHVPLNSAELGRARPD